MKSPSFKTIGIIGGVGPEATLDLYRWIVKLTPAKKDQGHIPTLVYSLPQIPDRTEALLYGGEDPLPYLIKAGQTIEQAGADFIIIPCNTAHAFTDKLQRHLNIPIISMIEATAEYVKRHYPNISTIGLLATTGTVKSKIYHQACSSFGLKLIVPSALAQENQVMEAIYGPKGVKAGYTDSYPQQLLQSAAKTLISRGAQGIIMGCSEIPLVLTDENVSLPLFNPTKILAQAAITKSRS